MANESSNVESRNHAGEMLSVVDVLARLRSRWFSILAVTGIFTALAVCFLLVLPDRYSSDGLFYVRLGRSAVALDPTSQASDSVSIQGGRDGEVSSMVEMLQSREIADRVVQQVGARQINEPRTWIGKLAGEWLPESSAEAPTSMLSKLDTTAIANQLAHEAAVEKLQSWIFVSVARQSYTVSVEATTPDPGLSKEIVQAYLDQYGAFHVQANETNGSYDFFDQQAKAGRQAAVDAQMKLQERRAEMGWTNIELAESSLQNRISELEMSADVTNSELAEAESRVKALQQQLNSIETWITTEVTSVANSAADGMKQALYQVKVAEGEQLSRVTPNHPRYKVLQKKLNTGDDLVADESGEREETRQSLNPIYQRISGNHEDAISLLAGLKGRKNAIQKSLVQAKEDLKRLSTDAIELSDLTWAAQIAERNYLLQSENLESARVKRELDRQELSDISVIQNASLNLEPAGPQRALLSLIALVGGLMLGCAQALIRQGPPTQGSGFENQSTFETRDAVSLPIRSQVNDDSESIVAVARSLSKAASESSHPVLPKTKTQDSDFMSPVPR